MAIVASNNLQTPVTFFGDASSKERDFMVAGGFAISNQRIAEVETNIRAMRELAGIREFHWSAYKGGRTQSAYEKLVEYAFSLVRNGHAEFHTIICPFKGYRHKAKKGENRDTSVNRMYFQLLLHRAAAYYGSKRAIHVRLDAGNDSTDVCALRNELCAKAFHRYDTKPNCIKSLQSMPSETSGIIQMADVILGGIAAKRNAVHHTSQKGPLADHILHASGHSAWDKDTRKDARKLTVWNFKGNT